MKSFKEKVYALAQKIPAGKVATYGQLATMAGNFKAARAVGALMRHNPDNKLVPCHRVVAANGVLTGFAFGGIVVKKKKLKKEGVVFNGERVNVAISGWRQ